MPWWPSSSDKASPLQSRSVDKETQLASDKALERVDWSRSLNETAWSHYTDPRNVLPVILLTSAVLGSYAFYRSYLRRIRQASFIGPKYWRKRSLFGTVTRVGDGDNFHLYHTPGGRLSGWGWLPNKRIPEKGKDLKDNTIHVRIAGVDAPEMAHFGRPEQPYAREAIEWLTKYLLHNRVRVYVYRKDQYDRAVATVYVRKLFFRKDVGLQMLKQGLATVYEAKAGAEFGMSESKYRWAERLAKMTRKGMWSGKKADFESPRDYKTRMAEHEKQTGSRN